MYTYNTFAIQKMAYLFGFLCTTIPTKHSCNLVSAYFDTSIALIFCGCADYTLFWCYLRQICIKFGANLAYFLIDVETAAIWDECSEQH